MIWDKEYFSDFQINSCFIAQGLMAGVLPF
jgi:hypothetical protein